MRQSLASVLFPGYRRSVLGLLLLHPEQALHGREIARRTGLPAGTLTRELNRLAEVGLLKREKRGNQQVFSADRSCPVFEEVAGILRKTSGLADVLAAALAPAASQLRAAFVFGSIAQGRETSASDIDVMLIGDVDFARAVEFLYPAQAPLARAVSVRVYTAEEFCAKAADDPFLRDVLSKPKLFLIGNDSELAELARRQS